MAGAGPTAFSTDWGKLGIIAPMGFVRDILELTEIHEWIPIFESEDEAWKVFETLETAAVDS